MKVRKQGDVLFHVHASAMVAEAGADHEDLTSLQVTNTFASVQKDYEGLVAELSASKHWTQSNFSEKSTKVGNLLDNFAKSYNKGKIQLAIVLKLVKEKGEAKSNTKRRLDGRRKRVISAFQEGGTNVPLASLFADWLCSSFL